VAGYALLKILSIHRSFSGVLKRFLDATVLSWQKPMVSNNDVR
jgi:hypothetical protein